MKILTTPWKDDFIELVSQSRKSIRITSPFVKYDMCVELTQANRNGSKIELITCFKFGNVYSNALDISALEHILYNNGIVKNFPKLHSKMYIFDDEKAIITSGNLTTGGLVKNFEYGILLWERSIIDEVVSDFNSLKKNDRTGNITRPILETAKDILHKIPKPKNAIPTIDIESPETFLDTLDNSQNAILNTLSGWTLAVFECTNLIPKQIFTLSDINSFEEHLGGVYPENKHIKEKIRQQLQKLRDLGLIEFSLPYTFEKCW